MMEIAQRIFQIHELNYDDSFIFILINNISTIYGARLPLASLMNIFVGIRYLDVKVQVS